MPIEGWAPTRLGSVAWEVSERAGEGAPEVLSVTKHGGFVPSLEYFGKQVFSKDTGNYKVVRRGQFAYATIHLDEGAIDILQIRDEGIISPMYTVFDVDGTRVDRAFLLELLKSQEMLARYSAIGMGSVNRRRSVGFDTLAAETIDLPPLPEQKKIAAILSSVDNAIRATQAVIDQTRRVKEGLLHDLLTRGIGPDGKPHTRFKQTEIGQIPEGWEVARLEDLCREKITYGIVQCGPHIEGGIPYIRVSDMEQRDLDVHTMLRTSQNIAAKFGRSRVETGDIVYALRGTIGEARIVPPSAAGANLTQGTARLSPSNRVLGRYLLWALRSPNAHRQAQLEAKGSTFKEITLDRLRRIQVPVPIPSEQAEIAERIDSLDLAERDTQRAFAAKQQLKSALLSDLLTGRVRVTP